jgi:hypothetical protein
VLLGDLKGMFGWRILEGGDGLLNYYKLRKG